MDFCTAGNDVGTDDIIYIRQHVTFGIVIVVSAFILSIALSNTTYINYHRVPGTLIGDGVRSATAIDIILFRSGDEGIVVVGADEFFDVDETVAAGVAPAAAVADGDDVITFGDGTEVYGDAFCGVGVGDGITVDVVVAAVQGVAAGTAVQGIVAVVAVQCRRCRRRLSVCWTRYCHR